MDLSTIYQQFCALDPEAFDVRLATAIDEVAVRAQTMEVQQALTVNGNRGLRDLLIDDVIRIGTEFGRLGAVEDQLLAQSVVVELLRPIGGDQPLALGDALGLLASLLGEAQRWPEALAYGQECAEVLRPFAIVDPPPGHGPRHPAWAEA